jgi:hypothetical protein
MPDRLDDLLSDLDAAPALRRLLIDPDDGSGDGRPAVWPGRPRSSLPHGGDEVDF